MFEDAFGHECVYLVAEREGRACGVLPLVSMRTLLFGRLIVSLPFVNYGGVVADDEEAARALLEAARREAEQRKARHIELRHVARRFPNCRSRSHKVAMTLHLPETADAMWKAVDNKVRNQVRKAEKSGLTAHVGGAELIDELYEVFARNMRDLGTPVYSVALFDEAFRAAGDAARVYAVRQGTRCLAAGITIAHRDGVENPWASSLREARPLCANMLLYWEMLRDSIARGLRVFDFGRSTPYESTYRFKQQWGAQPTALHWEYVLVGGTALPDHGPKSAKFQRLVALWQHRLCGWRMRRGRGSCGGSPERWQPVSGAHIHDLLGTEPCFTKPDSTSHPRRSTRLSWCASRNPSRSAFRCREASSSPGRLRSWQGAAINLLCTRHPGEEQHSKAPSESLPLKSVHCPVSYGKKKYGSNLARLHVKVKEECSHILVPHSCPDHFRWGIL